MDLVQFDAVSGERIARVVRAVEGQPQRTKPLVFDGVFQSSARPVFHFGTFSGEWPLNQYHSVTLDNNQTVTTWNDLSAINDRGSRRCFVAWSSAKQCYALVREVC